MHATLGVNLGLVGSRDVGELGALKDVEVVVGRVTASVALSTNSGA